MRAVDYVARIRRELLQPPLLSQVYPDVPKAMDGPCKPSDVLIKVCGDLAEEARLMAQKRKVSTVDGLLGCFREQDQKWRAVARHFPETAPPDFFKVFLREAAHDNPAIGVVAAQLCL
ncbi:MAG: hypothetical protein IT371_30820 [Deltaproteobacteria bacterium]|nr:hypothetical protein [Deltaproteobacteria bacterium]